VGNIKSSLSIRVSAATSRSLLRSSKQRPISAHAAQQGKISTAAAIKTRSCVRVMALDYREIQFQELSRQTGAILQGHGQVATIAPFGDFKRIAASVH